MVFVICYIVFKRIIPQVGKTIIAITGSYVVWYKIVEYPCQQKF